MYNTVRKFVDAAVGVVIFYLTVKAENRVLAAYLYFLCNLYSYIIVKGVFIEWQRIRCVVTQANITDKFVAEIVDYKILADKVMTLISVTNIIVVCTTMM